MHFKAKVTRSPATTEQVNFFNYSASSWIEGSVSLAVLDLLLPRHCYQQLCIHLVGWLALSKCSRHHKWILPELPGLKPCWLLIAKNGCIFFGNIISKRGRPNIRNIKSTDYKDVYFPQQKSDNIRFVSSKSIL